MSKDDKLVNTVSDFLLDNTPLLGYFERFEKDPDLLEDKLEEFAEQMTELIEGLEEALDDDSELDGVDDPYNEYEE